jgi:TRAP-type transport system periplasmic protein
MYLAVLAPTVVSILAERSGTMRGMNTPARFAALLLAAIAAFAATGCGGGGGGDDKAGGSGGPVELRLANPYGSVHIAPAVEYFVKHVEELSDGDLRIEVADEWGNYASNAEQEVVRNVSAGEIDLGWVGTRAFDTMGVKSFQALTAPMLVDSYGAEEAVIKSGITEQMMRGIEDLGVVGLGVLADGLRKPIGVSKPILGPADWRGISFGTLRSNGQAEAIRALGATPAQVFGPERKEGLQNGTIQGFEMNIWVYLSDVLPQLAPYVTSNVNLWPQMDVLLANPARLAALTGEQRGWLEEAAREAATRSVALADKDAETVGRACSSGVRFAEASPADLAALRSAFTPVYADLRTDPSTRAFIRRIEALKRSIPPGSAASMPVPADCTGKAPQASTAETGTAPSDLNGTYRYVITRDEARRAGDQEAEDPGVYPQVTTVTLEDGDVDDVQSGCFGPGASYRVDDHQITFHSAEEGIDTRWKFSRDDQGDLRLTPIPPMDPGAAFQCSSQVWTKIG